MEIRFNAVFSVVPLLSWTTTFSSKIRFSVNFNYSNSLKEDNYEFRLDTDGDGRSERVNVRQMAYIKAPNMAIWEHDVNGNLTGEYFTPIYSY